MNQSSLCRLSGRHVESGDTIYDMIQFKPVLRIVGTGWVGNIATHIYLAAEKENRFALPNTRFNSSAFRRVRQRRHGHADPRAEILKTRERINGVILGAPDKAGARQRIQYATAG